MVKISLIVTLQICKSYHSHPSFTCPLSTDLLVKWGSEISHSRGLEAVMQVRLYLLCRKRCHVNSSTTMLWRHWFFGTLVYYQKEQHLILFSLKLKFLSRTVPKLYSEVGKVETGQSQSQPLYSHLSEEWTLPSKFNNKKMGRKISEGSDTLTFMPWSSVPTFQIGRLGCQTVI